MKQIIVELKEICRVWAYQEITAYTASLKYLYEFTNELHTVTNQELVAMFANDVTSGNRKTIKNDIEVLTEAGYDIITAKQYHNSYYLASRIFEVPEVNMLIDAVVASRFVTKEKSDTLIEKLPQLVSRPQAETLSPPHVHSRCAQAR